MKTETMRLIVGLGNPGRRHVNTRHNAGFQVAERLASGHQAAFTAHARVPAMLAEWKSDDFHWLVLKPVTFMNRSGQAVAAALNFWKLPLDALLVVVDDVEVPPGGLRLRTQGSAGGHNGLKSVIEQLGTKEFARLRVGIGRPARHPDIDLSNWVLQPFEKSELPSLEEAVNKAVGAIERWVIEGPAAAMNAFNSTPSVSKENTKTPPRQD